MSKPASSDFAVDLSGCVALVTGASRGAGRAIAVVLAEAGATVLGSARSVGAGLVSAHHGTLSETATAAAARGGAFIPVRCDHTNDRDVRALVERVEQVCGRLDLLVNNVWGGYEQREGESPTTFFGTPFWEQPLWRWDAMFNAGVRAQFVTSRYAAPLLLREREERPGLIVHTVAWAFGAFLGNVLYDTAKAATARLAFGTAEQLRAHNVAVAAVAPGHLGVTETPEYLGRAVAQLAADRNIMEKTGSLFTVGELAREYGFTDLDGTQPPPWAPPSS